MANKYAGRYVTYPFCDDMGAKIATWLRQNGYSPFLGRRLRAVQQLGGGPGANEQQIALANQLVTTVVGQTAVNAHPSEG